MAQPKVSKAPDLKSLSPTTESFYQHILRARFQTLIWKSATDSSPPALEPEQFGWERDDQSKSLVPVMLPSNVPLAPPEILELIRCGCSSASPCSTARCRCSAAKLPCTIFCNCHSDSHCGNACSKSENQSDRNETNSEE